MGILKEPAKFVRKLVRKMPAEFSVCELGDQWLTYTTPHRLARDWYVELGAGLYQSIDANGNGEITHDLNRPLPENFVGGGFDLVTDFGTGEHVFDQAQVWRTIHDLTKVGGFIVFDRPASCGWPGHGFYLVDECLLRDIAGANAYDVLRLEEGASKRGKLIRGVFRRTMPYGFHVPQQGRYRRKLKVAP